VVRSTGAGLDAAERHACRTATTVSLNSAANNRDGFQRLAAGHNCSMIAVRWQRQIGRHRLNESQVGSAAAGARLTATIQRMMHWLISTERESVPFDGESNLVPLAAVSTTSCRPF
jgi:type 1 glutamine amidotransferase